MNVKLAHCPVCGDILNTIAAGGDDGIIEIDDMRCVHCRLVWRIEYPPFEHAGEVRLLGFRYSAGYFADHEAL